MFYIQYVKEILGYLYTYNMTPRELAMTMIQDVLKATGITATAGIGTNMYRLFSFYFQALIGLYF